MTGFVYFLTNRAMPGLLKIGYTKLQLHERLAQLNGTGVPVGFEIGAAFAVTEPARVEKSIHNALAPFRYNQNREFFSLSLAAGLSESIEHIFPYLSEEGSAGKEAVTTDSGPIESKTIEVLKALAGPGKRRGFEVRDLCDVTNESELQVENRLAQLAERKLVQERRTREDWLGNVWSINSRGVKYLFDSGLVEDYMLDDRWG